MKYHMKAKFFFSAIMMVVGMTLFAQRPAPHTFDFSAVNTSGDTIYYLITSPQTVAVSFRCDSATGQTDSSYLIWYKLKPTKRNMYHGNLNVPDKVVWQSVEYRITAVAAYTFNNISLTSVSLPEGIESVGDYNFTSCSGLKKLKLPDSVRHIGNYCFQSADLEEVEMGGLVSHLGEQAFSYSGIRRFVCPPSLNKIERSFRYCPNLSEVILPEGLDSITNSSFYSCYSLRNIQFPNTLEYVVGFTETGLETASFPATIRIISGFSCCPNLSSLDFLGAVDSIGQAFRADTSLHYLDLSASRIHTWTTASLFNKTMRSIILPKCLENINHNVFGIASDVGMWLRGRPHYFSLVLPENLKSLSMSAWSYMLGSTSNWEEIKGELILKSKTPPRIYSSTSSEMTAKDTARNKPYTGIQVYVPCGSLEAYKKNLGWRYLYPNIREMDMVEVVLDSMCDYQIQAMYGFIPDQPGVYTVAKPAVDSLHCDTLVIYYVRHIYKSKVADTSIRVNDDGSAFEWTWDGNGDEYEVLREGSHAAMVKEPYYRDTAVETGVQYCYNFIPYLHGCKGETSPTNCYTRVPDSTGVDSSGVGVIRTHNPALYPNPVTHSLFLTNGERYANMPYMVSDVTGRIMMQGNYNTTEGIRVDVLAKGVYMLRLEGRCWKFIKL